MGIHELTTENLVGAHAAIIWPLGGGETVFGPTEWVTVGVKDRVLLFEPKPRLSGGGFLHNDVTRVSVVTDRGLTLGAVCSTHDEDAVAKEEWIGVEGHWMEVDVTVHPHALSSAGSVKVPHRQVLDCIRSLWKCLCLSSYVLA